MKKLLMLLALLPAVGWGQTTNVWRGPTNGALWSVVSHWSQGVAPSNDHLVYFSTNGVTGVTGSNTACRVDIPALVQSINLTNYNNTVTFVGTTNTMRLLQASGTTTFSANTNTINGLVRFGGTMNMSNAVFVLPDGYGWTNRATTSVGTSLVDVMGNSFLFPLNGASQFYSLNLARTGAVVVITAESFNAAYLNGSFKLFGGTVSNASPEPSALVFQPSDASATYSALPGSKLSAWGNGAKVTIQSNQGSTYDLSPLLSVIGNDGYSGNLSINSIANSSAEQCTYIVTNCTLADFGVYVSPGTYRSAAIRVMPNVVLKDLNISLGSRAFDLGLSPANHITNVASYVTVSNVNVSSLFASAVQGVSFGLSNVNYTVLDSTFKANSLSTRLNYSLTADTMYITNCTFTMLGGNAFVSTTPNAFPSNVKLYATATITTSFRFSDVVVTNLAARIANTLTTDVLRVSGGSLTTDGATIVVGAITNSSIINATSSSVFVTKNFINTGNFNAQTSTVVFASTGPVSSNVTNFYNLVVDAPRIDLSNVTVTVANSLSFSNATPTSYRGIANAKLRLPRHTLLQYGSLSNVAVLGSNSLTVYGSSQAVTGRVKMLPNRNLN